MTSIIYVGMDVHTTNYTLCCYSIETNQAFAQVQVDPDYKEILRYLNQVSLNVAEIANLSVAMRQEDLDIACTTNYHIME